MLVDAMPGLDALQLGWSVQLVLQQVDHLFGFAQKLAALILLQITDERLFGRFKHIHIGVVVRHVEITFRHGRVNLFQNGLQHLIGSLVISHFR
ncbi:hypothetical protein D3C81_1201520 [compost metagenome]